MTTSTVIHSWFKAAKAEGSKYLIVACDSFSHEDYPVFCKTADDALAGVDRLKNADMQRVMEVYDISLGWKAQEHGRVMNLPKAGDSAKAVSKQRSVKTSKNTVVTIAPERVSRGFYKHSRGDVYFVLGVGTLDMDGHGDYNAPRQVVYESTRSVKDGLLRLRSEEEFVRPIAWPDGVVRPRFVRMEHQ